MRAERMMSKGILKRGLSACIASCMAFVPCTGTLCAYAESLDDDSYAVYFDGSEYRYELGTTDITSDQGDTILDYNVEREEYDDYAAADGNEISEERLADSVIDYDELGTFIHNYNLTVVNTRDSIEASAVQYETIKDEILSEYIESIREARSAKSDGDADTYAEYYEYKVTYKAAIQSYNSIIDNLSSQSTIRSLKSVEKSLTYAAQSLMISYAALRLSNTSLTKSVELYKALYDNTVLMVSAGMATEADLMSAYDSYKNAEQALDSLSVSMTSVYNSLCLLLGLDVNAGYTIGEIPDPDTEFLASIDTAADEEAYVNSNSAVSSARKVSSGGTAGYEVKEANVQEAKSEAKIGYQSLYASLKEAQSTYEAALIGYESAESSWNTAQSKNSLGMLSNAEYIQAQLAYIAGYGELLAAKVSLFNVINTYKWSLKGVG